MYNLMATYNNKKVNASLPPVNTWVEQQSYWASVILSPKWLTDKKLDIYLSFTTFSSGIDILSLCTIAPSSEIDNILKFTPTEQGNFQNDV